MNRAVFLDRDGTINIDKHYVYQVEDFEYLPGVVEALKLLQSAEYLLIVITNQSGIARGYFTEEDYKELEQWIKSDLKSKQVNLTASYYCPHLPEAVLPQYKKFCTCRKPKLGLFEKAINEYQIDIKKSYVIGDKLRDLAACAWGCRGFLIGNSEKEDIISAAKDGKYQKISYCEDLKKCVYKILTI